MRRWLSLNGLLVGTAAMAALVLTVTRPAPEGLINLGVGDRPVRAAPGTPEAVASKKHNLLALNLVNRTLIRIRESYVEPSRIDPQKMLYAALDSVQFRIPEVMVASDPQRGDVEVVVNDKSARFSTKDVDSPWRLAKTLKSIVRFVEANMNPGADLAEVEYALVNGMLSTLDPHSILLDPEQSREMDVSTSGAFGGLGVVIGLKQRKLTVLKPMKGTPAYDSGLKPHDTIVRINDEVTENLTLSEAVERMRGKRGTKVVLWIERKGEAKALRFEITRAQIDVPSVESRMLTRGVGYIRLKQFAGKTSKDVSEALTTLRQQGAKSFVLDMRWNPGGLLEQAIQVGDLFLDQGTIVTTVGGNEREPRRAERDEGDVLKAPLAVLVNGGSASASEIVAGALKNLDRAVTIGTTTFGKGSVQILYDNDDSSKLKLTIAQYLTPGDLSIQSIGIVPDIELSRMNVPAENKTARDYLRLLPSTKSYREKDLKSHLDSTYAVEGPRPETTLAYLYEPPAKTPEDAAAEEDPTLPGDPDDDEEGPVGPEDDEEPLDDEFVMDYEISLARDVLAEAGASTRKQILRNSKKLLEKRRAVELKRLTDKLAALNVDWSAPPTGASSPPLDASFAIEGDAKQIRAGQEIVLTGSVTNRGTTPAFRVLAHGTSDDDLFDDNELVFGKIDPGATRTWSVHLKVDDDALDRMDHVEFELRDAAGVVRSTQPALAVRVAAAERPVFAYSHQLVDASNGDGLVQAGESYKLRVTVKNIGTGEAREAQAVLRNASGDDLKLRKTRFDLASLKPGESKSIEFSFESTARVKGDEVVVEMQVYDLALREGVSDKLHYPVRKPASISSDSGTAQVSARSARIHEGASGDSAEVATAPKGSTFAVTGRIGDWVRIDLGDGRPGFLEARDSTRVSGRAKPGTVALNWQVTPPTLSLEVPTYEVNGPTFRLKGKAVDDSKVEDVYVFVSNREAKVENRKVFYRSNRGATTRSQMTFAPDIPVWPGSNLVTVIVRENDEVKSSQTMFLYRPKGASKAVSTVR